MRKHSGVYFGCVRIGAAVICVAAALALLGSGGAEAATTYHFITLDNTTGPLPDANFNQLLGISNAEVIVGYDGDGSVKPNKGYVLVPTDHYAAENFPKSAQTQVTGINDNTLSTYPFTPPMTVGFAVDGKGNNFGFANVGNVFVEKSFPNTPTCSGVKTNQLLGVNDTPIAVGFYLDAKCNSHGYIYEFSGNKYTETKLPAFAGGVVSVTAAGINNSGIISGFYSDKAGNTHGFYGAMGAFKRVDVPTSVGTGTTFLGINDNGLLVGFATAKSGASVGIIYNANTGATSIVKDPGQSTKTAFGVAGTIINGVNDNNELVGFFSDGTKVHGFLAAP